MQVSVKLGVDKVKEWGHSADCCMKRLTQILSETAIVWVEICHEQRQKNHLLSRGSMNSRKFK